jgi:hypothetical protein
MDAEAGFRSLVIEHLPASPRRIDAPAECMQPLSEVTQMFSFIGACFEPPRVKETAPRYKTRPR